MIVNKHICAYAWVSRFEYRKRPIWRLKFRRRVSAPLGHEKRHSMAKTTLCRFVPFRAENYTTTQKLHTAYWYTTYLLKERIINTGHALAAKSLTLATMTSCIYIV